MPNAYAIHELILELESDHFIQTTGQLQRFPGDLIYTSNDKYVALDYNGHCCMGVESVCLASHFDDLDSPARVTFGDWHYDATNGKWRNADEHITVRNDKIPDDIAEQVFGENRDSSYFREVTRERGEWNQWLDASEEERLMMLKGQPRYIWMNDVLGKNFKEIAAQLRKDYATELAELPEYRPLTTQES